VLAIICRRNGRAGCDFLLYSMGRDRQLPKFHLARPAAARFRRQRDPLHPVLSAILVLFFVGRMKSHRIARSLGRWNSSHSRTYPVIVHYIGPEEIQNFTYCTSSVRS
jgi:hypothetical protein